MDKVGGFRRGLAEQGVREGMVHYYSASPYPSAQPARPMVRSENGLGVAGFIISVLAILTCGILSPIALLVSLAGMLRRPRGFAIAGVVLGGLGTALVCAVVALTVSAAHTAREAAERIQTEATTRQALMQADKAIWAKIAETGELPEGIEGNKVVIQHNDAWGRSLRYDRTNNEFVIRSAGADGEFETADDITSAKSVYPPAGDSPAPQQPIPLE